MKNLLNTLGGALGGSGLADKLQSTLGGSVPGGLADKLQSTLGSVTGSVTNSMPNSVSEAAQSLKSGAANSMAGLGNLDLKNMNLGGMLGSVAIGGLLGALFTGKSAGKIAKGALVVGGTAAAGALAYKFYQKWSQTQVSAETVSVPGQQPLPSGSPAAASPSGWPTALESTAQPVQQTQQALPPAENTALLLLEAMVFAARADGHIDEQEKAHIHNAVSALFPQQDINPLLDHMLSKPIDPSALAARVRNPEEARDLYRLSCTVIVVDSFMERSYLDGLAQALRIASPEKEQLESEAEALRRQAE